jgi:antitoxin ParD1/3/4
LLSSAQAMATIFVHLRTTAREALRLLERADQQEVERIKVLRRVWQEGIDSGDAGEINFAELRQTAQGELAARKQKA